MDTNKHAPTISLEETILKAKIAQICDSVGYQAITQDSSNILVDIYRRTIHHLARHCKDAANNNRRIEPTIPDLVQAYDFVGISIPELQEYIETVKLPLKVDLIKDDEQKPSNRIQRNLLVDDLLEAEKNSHLEDQEYGENKDISECGVDEEEKPTIPLLKDTFGEIINNFSDFTPVSADKKIRLGGRIVLLANTKLKITAPIPPDPIPSTSGSDSKLTKKKKKKGTEKKGSEANATTLSPIKQTKGKKRKKLSREFVLPEQAIDSDGIDNDMENSKETIPMEVEKKVKTKEKAKDKVKEKSKVGKRPYNKKPKIGITPLDLAIAEPPSFFPLVEEPVTESSTIVKTEKLSPSPKLTSGIKNKRKKRSSLTDPKLEPSSGEMKESTKGKGRKKVKTTVITPLDPSIAEPPSFFPILDTKVEELQPEMVETTSTRLPTPLPTVKQTSKSKKKKKSSNTQFAIVTETVSAVDKEEKEWFCPACGKPDDGDWVQCDTCEEWYHLICSGLKKAPEDDENWECNNCLVKAKNLKKPQIPVEVLKLKTPEPVVIRTPPPIPSLPLPPSQPPSQPQPQPPPPANVVGGTQDDLCPECNLPDDGTMMIQCDDPFCAKWFHGKCVNLLEEPKEDDSWFCKVCVDKQQSAFKRRRRPK